MAIARNKALVFDVEINGITVGTGELKATGANVEYEADRDAVMAAGETEVEVYHNHVRRVTFDFYPRGTALSDARTAQVMDTLKPGKALTTVSTADSDLNKVWIVDNASKQKRVDGHVVITVRAHCYDVHGTAMGSTEITI